MGFGVMIFLMVLSGLLYLSYRRVWKGMSTDCHHFVGRARARTSG